MLITVDVYKLFLKHGSEMLWLTDTLREIRPKGTNKNTDEAFTVLEKLDECLFLYNNTQYSAEMKIEYLEQIEHLKQYVHDEVFLLMEKKSNT